MLYQGNSKLGYRAVVKKGPSVKLTLQKVQNELCCRIVYPPFFARKGMVDVLAFACSGRSGAGF